MEPVLRIYGMFTCLSSGCTILQDAGREQDPGDLFSIA